MDLGVDVREEDLRRWEKWLRTFFPSAHVARERVPSDARLREGIWHVEFQDGKLGRIHVTGPALKLSGEAFARITERLNRMDWYAQLDQFISIRIDSAGVIERVS